MKKSKSNLFLHIANVVTIALIVECFLCAMLAVRRYALEDCFDRIEETAQQATQAFVDVMDDSLTRLTIFADILAANESNPEPLLQTYMQNFCQTQHFSAVCIHRRNGSTVSYGEHPHNTARFQIFAEEIKALPYVSEVFIEEGDAEQACFYQAVPIIRDGNTIAILYGYIPLEHLPGFVTVTAYDGTCRLYIVDGDTGNFLMNTLRGSVSEVRNITDPLLATYEVKTGYDVPQMWDGLRNGTTGYHIFRPRAGDPWHYTYYMPLGINNWAMMLTVEEPVAFDSYNDISIVMMALSVLVVLFMLLHVLALMAQTRQTSKRDKARLKKSQYMYEVQRALLNAHNNAEFIDQALKTVAEATTAETVLLMSVSGRVVSNVYYWPSVDKASAQMMQGRSVRDNFPVLFDKLSAGESVLCTAAEDSISLSVAEKHAFAQLEIDDVMISPILDNTGLLRGAICAVNTREKQPNCELLECLTYDFFMAITNVENHSIIKKRGAMDYLTQVKNRNSFESELGELVTLEGESLWCVFVDVNGLHEVNNTQGHKAGDLMLCTVADSVKRAFGDKYTYRMGGDEFVAFVADSSHEHFLKKKKALITELAVKGYYVSVGFEGVQKAEDGTFDITSLVDAAETIMYHDKWEYYQKNNIPSSRGHFPNLEKVMTAKPAADSLPATDKAPQ